MELNGRTCLVTGCSSGIGEAVAAELARWGAVVWASARRGESVASLRAAGLQATQLDVTDPRSVRSALACVGDIDVLVNSAGYGLYGAVEEIEDDELFDQFNTNFFGPWRLCRGVLPGMRQRRTGVIVNISSFAGVVPMANGAPYRTSKYALEGLSGTLHYEVSHFGIRIIDIQLGNVATRFSESMRIGRNSTSDGPYVEMRQGVDEIFARMCPTALTPQEAAVAVVAEIQKDSGPLRVAVGQDAHRLVELGKKDDVEYEAYVVEELRFTWHPSQLSKTPHTIHGRERLRDEGKG